MAEGFYADVPVLDLTCDSIRCSGNHTLFVWTFTGHAATSVARGLNPALPDALQRVV